MARAVTTQRKAIVTASAWLVGFIIFFPILWMVITSFKTEGDAGMLPPKFLFFSWTMENYNAVLSESNYVRAALNSIFLSVGSTLLGLIFAVPAAWAMAFAPGKKTKDLLLWMLSTKMMPAVGALMPIFLLFNYMHWLDSRWSVMVVLFLLNLPIVVWMLYTYFKEIPGEILEAARMDGASLWREIVYVLTPMAVPGIASTLLLNTILAWNEAFWTINLTAFDAAPLTQFIAGYSSRQGLFWAALSSASTLAILPIVVLGWFSQKQLVRGLTFGAVK
jgi:sorbitol/mannitol transport system permease protein